MCKKLFFLISVVLLSGSTGSASTDILIHYDFEGNTSNSGTLGPAGDGTVYGDPTYVDSMPGFGKAIKLVGNGLIDEYKPDTWNNPETGSWVDINDTVLPNFENRTIALWAKRQDIHPEYHPGTNETFIVGSLYTYSTYIAIDNDGYVKSRVRGGDMEDLGWYGHTLMKQDKWYHLGLVIENTADGRCVARFYVNGVLQGEQYGITRHSDAYAYGNYHGDKLRGINLGSYEASSHRVGSYGNFQFADVTVDDFRIYGRALPQAEIRNLCDLDVAMAYSLNYWGDFGDRVMYFLGSDRCSLPIWLKYQQQIVTAFDEPDSNQAVSAVESFLEQTLKAREQDSSFRQGRITLNENPRCILGLYLADRFPGTRLAGAAKKQIERSIERSYLTATGAVPWRQLLETELTKTKKNPTDGLKFEFFDEAEVPFLLSYLAQYGSSQAVRQQAGKHLAHCLKQQYGLEPALRQYYILTKQGCTNINEPAKLKVAQQLEQTGAVCDAQQLYEKLLQTVPKAKEALELCRQAVQIKRPTSLPQWFKPFQIKEADIKKLTAEEQSFFAMFLRGRNELIDGNFEVSAANLLKAKEIVDKPLQESLVYNAKKTIPTMLMLAYAKMGDYARAERYGFEAMRIWEKGGQASKQLPTPCSQIEKVDDLLFVLSNKLRTLQKGNSRLQLASHAKDFYTAITQNQFSTGHQRPENGLVQLFWGIKRQRVARLLAAECDLTKTQLAKSDNFKEFLELEPIMFTAQLLGKDSLEQIGTALADTVPQQYAEGQMYRFAKFAQQLNRPYMVRNALNVAEEQIGNVNGSIELLNDIAEMYLDGKNHQKAIEIYDRIAEQAADSNEAEKAQFEIIKIYADQLRLYDKAIGQCQKFLKKFPHSRQISQPEFLIGKLAYLNKDYTGAVGQLDSFIRKYPDRGQTGEAMMLAALSRMSEGNNQDAIDRFKEIIEKHPDGDLAARSKFLIGYTQVSEQEYSQALETFRQLIEQFPQSEYTKQAQDFIDRLSKVSK